MKTKKRNTFYTTSNTNTNTYTKKNKCSFLKSKLKPLPLSFFIKLSKQIIQYLHLHHTIEKYNNKIKQILQKYPFCISNNEKIIISIYKNKSFTQKEKERRIIIALIDFAWQNITTGNADIGILTNKNKYCENKTCRPIKEEYQYYKNVHNLSEKKYVYL
jgi:hypothetical protein